jgi:hypothetical protein
VAITSSDLATRLSGGSGNTDPNASIGGAMSSTAWTGGTLHDLFDVISGSENAASTVDYRCVYVRNGHGSLTWQNVVVWMTAPVANGADAAIGLGASSGAAASATPTAVSPANETTAPSGVTFSTAATSQGAGLSIGNVGPGFGFPIWIRRTAANSAALSPDGFTLSFSGDTAP